MEQIPVRINTSFIKLDQLLKFSGIADTGSMAKGMILDECVTVNGEICTMRGKKVGEGDQIRIRCDGIDSLITVHGR